MSEPLINYSTINTVRLHLIEKNTYTDRKEHLHNYIQEHLINDAAITIVKMHLQCSRREHLLINDFTILRKLQTSHKRFTYIY